MVCPTKHLKTFIQWLLDNGASLPYVEARRTPGGEMMGLFLTDLFTAVRRTHSANGGEHGDANVGKAALAPVLARIPRHLLLLPDNVVSRAEHSSSGEDKILLEAACEDANNVLIEREAMVMCLLQARRCEGSSQPAASLDHEGFSFWRHYAKVLPVDNVDTPAVRILRNLTELADNDHLDRCRIDVAAQEVFAKVPYEQASWPQELVLAAKSKALSLCRRYRSITRQTSERSIPDLPGRTLVEYAAVDATVCSRVVSFAGANPEFDPLVMVPFIDFCNHSDEPNARWRVSPTDGAVELVLNDRGIHKASPGDEITISYGDRPLCEFLFVYGFAPDPLPTVINRERPSIRMSSDVLWATLSSPEAEAEILQAKLRFAAEHLEGFSSPVQPLFRLQSSAELHFLEECKNRNYSLEFCLDTGLDLPSRRFLTLCLLHFEDGLRSILVDVGNNSVQLAAAESNSEVANGMIAGPDSEESLKTKSATGRVLRDAADFDDFVCRHPLYPVFRLRVASFFRDILSHELESAEKAAKRLFPQDDRSQSSWDRSMHNFAKITSICLRLALERCSDAVERLMEDSVVVQYLEGINQPD